MPERIAGRAIDNDGGAIQVTTYQGFGRSKLVQRYLNLLEAALTGMLIEDAPDERAATGLEFNPHARLIGGDWPSLACSMTGGVRMRFLRHACETVLLDGVPGDFIETGVWRGGSCIMMKGILEAYGDDTRRVFAADIFGGSFPSDSAPPPEIFEILNVPREQVERNFRRFGLLDERVLFLEGWFKDTLPNAPIDQLAVLRLDGDMYGSTMDALDALYHKLSYGGYVIVDDFDQEQCAQACHDFRKRHAIGSPILPIDYAGTYWRVDHEPIG